MHTNTIMIEELIINKKNLEVSFKSKMIWRESFNQLIMELRQSSTLNKLNFFFWSGATLCIYKNKRNLKL